LKIRLLSFNTKESKSKSDKYLHPRSNLTFEKQKRKNMNDSAYSITGSKLDTILAGTYRLIEEIGTGSYGCLLLGQHVDLGTYHAIKVLTKSG
jgi:hypothetical protein